MSEKKKKIQDEEIIRGKTKIQFEIVRDFPNRHTWKEYSSETRKSENRRILYAGNFTSSKSYNTTMNALNLAIEELLLKKGAIDVNSMSTAINLSAIHKEFTQEAKHKNEHPCTPYITLIYQID